MSIVAPDSGVRQSGSARTYAATAFGVLLAISSVHMLNDAMQAVVTALFPVLEQALRLTYTQLGWLSFALNMTSSVLQPFVGQLSDRRPFPRLLPIAMLFTLAGLVGLALAPRFPLLIVAVVAIGLGSAIFHPEGSRIVYYAAGPRRSLAQSIYQVGGNAGTSLAPLMTMFIFAPLGQAGALWTGILAVAAFAILLAVVPWYRAQLALGPPATGTSAASRAADASDRSGAADASHAPGAPGRSGEEAAAAPPQPASMQRLSRHTVRRGLFLLVTLAVARSWYHSGMASYFQFFAIEKFSLSIEGAQLPLFVFMAAGVAGTLAGGLLGDRIGPRTMMLVSIAGTAPLALLLPHVPLAWTYPVIALIGFILQSGFSVSVVYAQELLPDHVGMASGLIVGLAFGMGALGAVALGKASDIWGVVPVITNLSYVLLLGLLAFWLPRTGSHGRA